MAAPATLAPCPCHRGTRAVVEMDRLVRVYYGGRVVEPYVGGHVEFEDMSLKTILFPTHPTLDELRSRVKEVLGWTEDNVEIRFYGRYDVGQGHKYILNVIGQLEWEVYFDLVKESQFRSLEVFASKLVRTVENLDLNKSPSYHYVEKNFVTYYSRRGGGASKSELVREDLEGEGEKKRPLLGNDLWEAGPSKRHCGTDDVDAARVMKRELEQEGLDLSEHLSASVHWSSYGVNPEYPTEVAGQYVNPDDYFDVELSGGHDSVSVEVNRDDVDEEASVEQYDVEFAEDSDDDRLFPPLTNNDKLALEECRAFEKVFGRKPDIPEFRDLTHAHGALLDDGINLDQLPEPFQVDGLRKGLEFPSMVTLKLWLQEYAIVHHRPYRVVNSAANRRYTVKCENPRCKWKQRNPSMVYHIDTHPDRVVNVDGVTKKIFMRAFWCFGPSIEAFKHCRPVLAIDATFLTGKYGGALMTALSADAEDQLVPLAFALVEKENSRDWCWFIDLVRRVVVGPHREWIFERDVEALRQRIPEGPRKWLEDELLDKDKWSRAYDRNGRRWGYMTTNMAEQFNSVLVGVRKLPVTAIVSFTFMKCNDYFVNRHDEALKRVQLGQRWSTKVDSKMKVQESKANKHTARCFDKQKKTYEVTERGGITRGGVRFGARAFKVEGEGNSCSCQRPLLYHMPCSHLIHVYLIHAIDKESPNRMPYQFSSRAVVNTWASRFEPYLDPTQWPSYNGEEFVADPNLKIKTRGKRRSKRFKNEMDSGLGGSGRKPPSCVQLDAAPVQNRCSLCHQEGHKKTKCPKRPKKKKSKKNLSVREVLQPLRVRAHAPPVFDDRYIPYLRAAGLLRVALVVSRGMPVFNAPALTALVNRWRPETHSFHLPSGEMTITLQDVAMILALPLRGHAVTGRTETPGWHAQVQQLFGIPLNIEQGQGGKKKQNGIPLSWLSQNFSHLDDDAEPWRAECYARAYILHLLGGVLFPDAGGDIASAIWIPLVANLGDLGRFSWGSAVLAWTYRQLCEACCRQAPSSNMSGCVLLIQMWMWLRLPNEPDMEKTVAYLFESTATAHAHRDVAYKHYVNEMDYLQPQHIEWLPYHTNEASSLTLNSMCNRDSDYFMYQCPLICFWAVEYHLPHRVMRQFGKKQDWPVEDISTGVELHKYDRVRTKKVKDWGLEHNRYIDEWRTAGMNDRYIETIHQNHLFSEYLRWLHRTYRLFLRPTWTEADIEDDRDSDEGRNPYDSRELLRSVNEMGHALQAPRGGEDTENTLRNVLEKVRQRCRKLAARLGCRSVGLDDVYQPGRQPPPLPQSTRPSTARHSIRIEEREGVGGSSSSRIKQGRGKGKAPAPPSDDDDDEDEEDEDYVAPDAEEIDMSQLPDAPQGTQPTQYNL
ncbi:Os05g0319000 [Oryza sativa Japonica Group]|uniref:Os05g0319000 protein n=1 Tax=Oryza sativa subsp. japonica TaxID=39947 RepID=C7J340_ORYSJ|nr:Os05g0319000 [Oryza sativa Japonica Group]|eukprot:NP_001174346.1 Os05g0319000 [Oryza sativa Japonica Group]